jgi:3-hydroxyisobutyrate dehydrogenase
VGKQIGFVGLGTMGRPMAINLIRAGHRLTVYDLEPAGVQALVTQGAVAASSSRQAAESAEVVISVLPASQHVLEAMLGPDGVVAGLRSGSTVIDMSTIDPGTTRRVAKAVTAKGAHMLDAPVSGSSAGAEAGTLTIMVGGEAAVLEAQRDVLGAMGSNIIHCGPIGMGETVKLCNNLIVGTTMAAIGEAFALGRAAGADPKVLFDVIGKSTGNSWALQNRPPVAGLVPNAPVNEDFKPGFMIDLMHKDLGLIMAAGAEFKVPLPLTAVALELYALARAQGLGRKDMSAVATVMNSDRVGEVARQK